MQQNKKAPAVLVAGIKDADVKLGIVTGYLASFNNLDSDNDIILSGAFTKTIAENGPASSKPRIKYLLDHNQSKALGVFTVLHEDTKGLYYEAQAGSHILGQDFIKMVESGLITEHSIGYASIKKTVINPDADWHQQQTQLQELKLYEGSALQCWGANENTPLTGMKALKYAEQRIPNIISALKNGTFSDKTFEYLEKELLFLQQAFKSENETTEPEGKKEDTTQPNDDENKMLINGMQFLNMRIALLLNN